MKYLLIIAGAVVLTLALLLVERWYRAGPVSERTGIPMNGRIEKTDAEWRQQLTPAQYRITREKGTERAFTGEYWDCHDDGVYRCICCGAKLFDAATKYESGTGWPSFWQPIAPEAVATAEDRSLFVEVEANNPFREREAKVPMRGHPVRWASIDGDTLHVYSFVVLEDGRYELQIYDRVLTDSGLEIIFRRFDDGELVRQIKGNTVRVETR